MLALQVRWPLLFLVMMEISKMFSLTTPQHKARQVMRFKFFPTFKEWRSSLPHPYQVHTAGKVWSLVKRAVVLFLVSVFHSVTVERFCIVEWNHLASKIYWWLFSSGSKKGNSFASIVFEQGNRLPLSLHLLPYHMTQEPSHLLIYLLSWTTHREGVARTRTPLLGFVFV